MQYHWFNRGYASFDDFLGKLSSRKRKVIRKERAAACAGLDIVTLRGAEIAPDYMAAMWHFYQDTGSRKWGRPYLTEAWFEGVVAAMGDAVVLVLALRDGAPIAGALNFVGERALYGRYWGAAEEVPFLHFELSYYRAIDFAIAHGLTSVQAGAQGEHKRARGYELWSPRPALTPRPHFAARSPTSWSANAPRLRARSTGRGAPALPPRRLGSEGTSSSRSVSNARCCGRD